MESLLTIQSPAENLSKENQELREELTRIKQAEMLTVDEVQAELGLKHKWSIYNLICAGEIVFVKRGRRLYMSRGALASWISQRKIMKRQVTI